MALKARFRNVLKGIGNSLSMMSYLGCSISNLRRQLEGMWGVGMSWENHGREGWHVDHFRPLASFDLGLESERRLAWHHTNLRPMWATENMSKGATWPNLGRDIPASPATTD